MVEMRARPVSWHKTRAKLSAVDRLILPKGVLETVFGHINANFPTEACGFLAGRFEDTSAAVRRVAFVENIAESTDDFSLAPDEFARIRAGLQFGEELVGFFHSHAGDPEPSSQDKITMHILPLVWLIVGWTEGRSIDRYECVAAKKCGTKTFPVAVVTS